MNDTYVVTLHQDDFSFPHEEEFNWSEEQIKFLVNYAIENSAIGIPLQSDFKNYGLTEIVSGVEFSKVSYIESEQGYFIISQDMMLHIHIIYSRWD